MSIARTFPLNERNILCSQVLRAVISVPSNIAEGMGRMSNRERIHFIEIAYGSLMEVMCQMEIAESLGYIRKEELLSIEEKVVKISKMLSGLRKSIETKHNY